MLVPRVAAHFQQAGWSVAVRPSLAGDRAPFQPDLLVERGRTRRAILVRDEPPGAFAVGEFRRQCRARGFEAVLVCPEDATVASFCAAADVEFLPLESIGAVYGVGRAAAPPQEDGHGRFQPVRAPAPGRAHRRVRARRRHARPHAEGTRVRASIASSMAP